MSRRAIATLCVLPLGLLAAYGCGDSDLATGAGGLGPDTPAPSLGSESAPLELTPRVDPVGLGDIHETLRVTRLDFDAEIYVLPDQQGAVPGQAAIRFRFADGVARTELRGDGLKLDRAGRYQVLVRVRPGAGGSSVVLGGEYLAPEDPLEKPNAEPAPIPADEPAPIPADEPAPIPADEPREGAREKPEDEFDLGDTSASGEPVFVRSSRPFEFYAGHVEIVEGARELVVTWDIRNWLRSLLAEPLGLPHEQVIEDANGTGFSDVPADFNVRAR